MLLQRDTAVGAVIPLQMYVWTDDAGAVHRLLDHEPAVGAVIPLRMYAWIDDDGGVRLGYFDPRALSAPSIPSWNMAANG